MRLRPPSDFTARPPSSRSIPDKTGPWFTLLPRAPTDELGPPVSTDRPTEVSLQMARRASGLRGSFVGLRPLLRVTACAESFRRPRGCAASPGPPPSWCVARARRPGSLGPGYPRPWAREVRVPRPRAKGSEEDDAKGPRGGGPVLRFLPPARLQLGRGRGQGLTDDDNR